MQNIHIFSAKKSFAIFLAATLICQLVFGNFLFSPNALAQENEPVEEVNSDEILGQTEEEQIITQDPIQPINDVATTSENILEVESATTTEPVIENSTTTLIVTDNPVVPDVSHHIVTGIIRGLNVNELTVISQWQMTDKKENGQYIGADNTRDKGAQILPSGQYKVDKPVVVCAVVADPAGIEAISSVDATIYYPQNIAINKTDTGEKFGCGQVKSAISLQKLDQTEAEALLCERIRNNNNNLISWNYSQTDNFYYGYEQVCGKEGYLAKQTAGIYCAETHLAYNDSAGDYQTKIAVKNISGASNTFDSSFKYLELTTFEHDFSNIQYGPVRLNEPKKLNGDTIWEEGSLATIRNIGNTRLLIKIWQNDFGFGKTDNIWNITYTAKIGENGETTSYLPEQTTILNNPIDLGAIVSIDFGALVARFPAVNGSTFAGEMILSAEKVEPLTCQ